VIGCLAQGIPGRATSTNTIVFIKKNQVPQNRAKDVTYRLITCLMRPEKMKEPTKNVSCQNKKMEGTNGPDPLAPVFIYNACYCSGGGNHSWPYPSILLLLQ
jgi:hypothetical protein